MCPNEEEEEEEKEEKKNEELEVASFLSFLLSCHHESARETPDRTFPDRRAPKPEDRRFLTTYNSRASKIAKCLVGC